MKKLMILLMVVALFLGLSTEIMAQTATPRTALAAAVTASQTTLTVLSVTGVSTPTAANPQWMFVDGELMRVTDMSSTTLTVQRGQNGTAASAHQSSAMAFIGPSNAFITTDLFGQCTRTAEPYLPRINVRNGNVFDCILSGTDSTTYLAPTSTTSEWVSVNFLQVGRALPYKKLPLSATTYTLLASDEILGYRTNVAGTITIPAITGAPGKRYIIQLEHTGMPSLTIATSSGQLINGATSIVIPFVGKSGTYASYSGVVVYSDGQNWFASTGP